MLLGLRPAFVCNINCCLMSRTIILYGLCNSLACNHGCCTKSKTFILLRLLAYYPRNIMTAHFLITKNAREKRQYCKRYFTEERPNLSKKTKNIVTIFYFWWRVGEGVHLISFRFFSSEHLRSFGFFLSHAHFRVFYCFRCCFHLCCFQQQDTSFLNSWAVAARRWICPHN